MQNSRKLYLSIFDYNGKIVCDLYDNQSEISGQAVNVHISNERNGWRELYFDIPSTCNTDEGPKDNFRLQYLIAEYKIRAIEDDRIDWFTISEPQIKHNNFSKNVSVRAGHFSQNLKNKNLDLEFSDEEGNNVGTAERLLEIILAGTGFEVGHVGEQNDQGVWHTFLENDGTAKQRSLTGSAGTGSLGFIEKLCDVFEAKPVYRYENGVQYVDILPMNPFAKVEPEQIPYIIRDKDLNVLELHYDRNIHGLNKTNNTDNMATRLYAYGSSGDMNGICTLQNAVHYEWTFTAPATANTEYRFEIGNNVYYFTANLQADDELVWSNLDLTSMSYVYNNTQEIAYKVYKKPKTNQFVNLTVSDPVETPNDFAFLLGLQYYNDVGLMTEQQFQEVAKFQRDMPVYYAIIREASENYINSEAELSKIAEHSTGLLKLKISEINNGQYIIDTSVGENGVIYRTDYDKAERRYFQWHVTDKLNDYGDPVSGTPSVLFIVHNTNPVTYDMTYLKCIWDTNGKVADENDKPKDFEYSTGNYPVSFTVWDNNIRFTPATDKVYLFCTNSMSGYLGSRLSQIEAVYQDLYNVTMKHPVTFYDGDDNNLVIPAPTNTEYEWRYDYHAAHNGELYFCWRSKFAETTWHRVYISDSQVTGVNDGYFYNTRLKTLSRWNDTAWEKIEDKQITVNMFETVIYYCYRRDELYRGIYEYYFHDNSKAIGNYAIFDGYNAYWVFKLKQAASSNLLLDYVDGQVYLDVTFANNKPVVNINNAVRPSSVETRSVVYPSDNELRDRIFYPGAIDSNGIEVKDVNTNYRTGYINVASSTQYSYNLPSGSTVYYYDQSNVFTRKVNASSTGTFTTTATEYYIRVVVPEILQTAYIKLAVADSLNLLEDRPFVNGSIGLNGQDVDTSRYRTYSIQAYENTLYQYSLPAYSSVYYYDANLNFLGFNSLTNGSASTGIFTTLTNTRFIRIVSSTNNMSAYYVCIKDYDKIFYMSREPYTIISTTQLGEMIGITPLTKKFSDLADSAYEQYLPALQNAQAEVKEAEDNLSVLLGDMLKDGRWQDANYISGDEKRLYDDALYMLKQISYPEITYSFNFLDMYGVKNEHFYETHEVQWPRISMSQTAHLIDPEISVNCWAYIDKLDQWYKQEWKTTVEIDTKLTLASRHSFTDVIARIAEVSKEMKAKQALYDTAATGAINGSRLEGVIQINKAYLDGGSSNWYNDDKGNLVFESADGLSAMQLGGRGLGIATERTADGSWLWRTAATGYGLTADTITTGFLSADRIDAGTITLDKLSSNVGKELEISSNNALLLFATEDGSRPAGSLKTTDGYIEVKAGQGNTPAKINIVSGGELNLNGGNVNVFSEGEMNVSSGGKFVLKSQGADSINTTNNGLFVDSEVGVNFAGGRFKVEAHGNTMDVRIKANYLELGDTNTACVTMDASSQTINIDALNAININSGNTVTISANNTLNLITNGLVRIGKQGHLFTIGADTLGGPNSDTDRAYIYYNLDKYSSSLPSGQTNGVYIGTDGFALKQTNTSLIAANGTIALTAGSVQGNYVSVSASDANYRIWAGHPTPANAPFSVQKDGTLYASNGTVGGFTMTSTQFSSGSGAGYIAINTDPTPSPTVQSDYLHPYAIWAGNETAGSAPFRVKRDGTLINTKGLIANWIVATNQLNSGSGNSYVALNSNNALTDPSVAFNASTNDYVQPYAIWCGNETASSAPFRVRRDGKLYATGASISGNVAITGGSITIQNANQTQTFSVTDQGVLTANKGSIAGWSIGPTTLTGNKVGLAKTTNDTDVAIWAGSATVSSSTPFRVTQAGKVYSTGAELTSATINGGSFLIKDNQDNGKFEITTDGKIRMAAGWYIDPSDFSGPYTWGGTVNSTSSGYVNLNCNGSSLAINNPRISVGAISSGHSPFEVYSNGNLRFNGAGPAMNITSISASGMTYYDASGAEQTVNFNNPASVTHSWSGGNCTIYNSLTSTTLETTSVALRIGVTSGQPKAIVKADNSTDILSTDIILSLESTYTSSTKVKVNGVITDFALTDYWNTAYASGAPTGTVTLGSKVAGMVYNANIVKGDSTIKGGTIDLTGFTEGVFTKAAVNLRGAQITGTVYHTTDGGNLYYRAGTAVTQIGTQVTGTVYHTSDGGTLYYTAGTPVTKIGSQITGTVYHTGSGGTYYYKAGTTTRKRGSQISGTVYHTGSGGDWYYKAGSAVNKVGSSVTPTTQTGTRLGGSAAGAFSYETLYRYSPTSSTHYTPIGAVYWSTSNNYYYAGSAFTYYDVGTSSVLYYKGDAVTPINSNTGLQLTTAGTCYADGGDITPIDSNSGLQLTTAGTCYAAGTSVTPINGNGIKLDTVGSSVYYAGSSVTPISGDGIKLDTVGAAAYYAGDSYSAVTSPYYTKDS